MKHIQIPDNENERLKKLHMELSVLIKEYNQISARIFNRDAGDVKRFTFLPSETAERAGKVEIESIIIHGQDIELACYDPDTKTCCDGPCPCG